MVSAFPEYADTPNTCDINIFESFHSLIELAPMLFSIQKTLTLG